MDLIACVSIVRIRLLESITLYLTALKLTILIFLSSQKTEVTLVSILVVGLQQSELASVAF